MCRTSPDGLHDLPSSIDGDVRYRPAGRYKRVHHLDVGSSRPPCAVVTLPSLGREVGSVRRTPRLIAIDGRAGAGKSRFASALIPYCGDVALVRVDDFLWWGDIETWWPRLREEALEPLLAGRAAQFRARDWDNDPLGRAVGGNVVIEPAETVIIEGVTSSRRDLADRLDLAFWVEAPQDTRLRRGLERDGEDMRGRWQDWMVREDEFFASDGAQSRADYVIDGDPAVPYDSVREVVVLTDQ